MFRCANAPSITLPAVDDQSIAHWSAPPSVIDALKPFLGSSLWMVSNKSFNLCPSTPIATIASFANLLSSASPSTAAAIREPIKPNFKEFSKISRFENSSITLWVLSPITLWMEDQQAA